MFTAFTQLFWILHQSFTPGAQIQVDTFLHFLPWIYPPARSFRHQARPPLLATGLPRQQVWEEKNLSNKPSQEAGLGGREISKVTPKIYILPQHALQT